MKLLIDAGNTRVKWALAEQGQLLEQGALAHDALGDLASHWRTLGLESAWGACVAKPNVRAALDAASPLPIHWQSSQSAWGDVRNHYRNPAEQGVDRWLAVLAARAMYPQRDVVVALAGTALTVEALTAEGDYLGGIIVPGARLMLQALAGNTAQLQRVPGEWQAFPQATPDALASGAWDALAGAVERYVARLAARTGRTPLLLASGGDAAELSARLTMPAQLVDNLVLQGLSIVAERA
jgi:type III pantothenate kinase